MGSFLRIGLVLPPSQGVGTGNMRTAQRWGRVFAELGHEPRIYAAEESFDCEILVALNAVKSAAAIGRFREENPAGKLIVAITGTDLNRKDSPEWSASLQAADRVVVLQNKALKLISQEEQMKARVIYQGVTVPADLPARGSNEGFQVCVVGHLRQEKDPLLTAMASRTLEEESRIQVLQVGAILEEEYTQAVTLERQMNPRYQWLGELSKGETLTLIAQSDLLVLTSTSEGGPGVIGEAVALGTPILSTRINGVVGLLGEDYSGYFEPRDVMALAHLLKRAEKDRAFYQQLREEGAACQDLFSPMRERESWQRLLAEFG